MSVIFLMLFSFSSYSQEICNNGIDDDFDGLIDLKDTIDCSCDSVYSPSTIPSSIIPNPSFEDTLCCPSNVSQLNCARTWQQASAATSDYYNTCGFTSITGFAISAPPTPLPHGNGYVGYANGTGSPSYNNYKEYIGACLTSPMVAGTSYTLNFYIAKGAGSLTTAISLFGSTNCTNLPFGGANVLFGCPTNAVPWQQLSTSTITLSNTSWTLVTITFTPSQTINAIVLGPNCNPSPSLNYYYLDNFILNTTSSFSNYSIIDSGHYCKNNLILKAQFDSVPQKIQWYKDSIALLNDTNILYNVPGGGTGIYQFRLTYDTFCVTSSIFIVDSTIIDFDVNSRGSCLISSTTGQVFVTNHKSGAFPYKFKINGGGFQSDSTFRNLTPGVHTVQVEDSNTCTSIKTIEVDTFERPTANFYTDSVCYEQLTSFTDLSTISSGLISEWSWGLPGTPISQNSTYVFPIDGSFPITLTVKSDSGCVHDTTMLVTVHPLPIPNFTFSPSEIFTFDTRVCFANSTSGAIAYNWDFGFTGITGRSALTNPCTVTFPNDKSGTYRVKLTATTNFGCMDSVKYNVIILDGLFLFIPNSFSPNNDGTNDEFSISSEGIDEFEFIVFNRWGEEIFKTTNLQFIWNGTYQGSQVQIGQYPYKIRVRTNSGFISEKYGHINVVR